MTKSAFSTLAAASTVLLSPGLASAAVALTPLASVDVAQLKPTFGDTAFGAPTGRGNDGVNGNDNNGNWTHADYPTSAVPYPGAAGNAPNPYWEVDLQGSFDLTNVALTDRVGCCDPSRLHGSVITFMDGAGATVATETIPTTGTVNSQTYDFNNGGAGYANVARVRIDGVNGANPIQYFQFSEFDAFALVQTPINWAAGAFVGFYDNSGAAFGAWPGQPASGLTDGNLNTVSHGNTAPSHADFFFEVDLDKEILVDNIDLSGRGFKDGCCPERLTDYRVELLDASGNTTFSYLHDGATEFTDNLDVIGLNGGSSPLAQYVRIINANGELYGPQVAEIAVYGVIPEPSTAALLLSTLLLFTRRRRR